MRLRPGRCPYLVGLVVGGERVALRCERRSVLGSAGWHMHRASLASLPRTAVVAHPHIYVRWSSLSAPDHHVHYDRGHAALDGEEQ